MKQLAIYHDNKTKPSLFIEQISTLQEAIKVYLSSYLDYLKQYNDQIGNFEINEITRIVTITKHPINQPNRVEFVSQFKYEYVN